MVIAALDDFMTISLNSLPTTPLPQSMQACNAGCDASELVTTKICILMCEAAERDLLQLIWQGWSPAVLTSTHSTVINSKQYGPASRQLLHIC
jgi:hypothetical protein